MKLVSTMRNSLTAMLATILISTQAFAGEFPTLSNGAKLHYDVKGSGQDFIETYKGDGRYTRGPASDAAKTWIKFRRDEYGREDTVTGGTPGGMVMQDSWEHSFSAKGRKFTYACTGTDVTFKFEGADRAGRQSSCASVDDPKKTITIVYDMETKIMVYREKGGNLFWMLKGVTVD